MQSFRIQLLAAFAFLLLACSSDPAAQGDDSSLVGAGGSGGNLGTGGNLGAGGSAVGGQGTGGAGTGGTGAAPATGGQASTGGSGGSLGSGGSGATGGSGGTDASGGADGSGGAPDRFEPCPVNGDPCAILPLGDSITEGFGSSGGGYRVNLFRQALANDQAITFVGTQQNGPNTVDGQPFPRDHQGHGGYTIDSDGGHSGISGSITRNALDSFHPHIVLLMIGTNDINGNVDVQNAPNRLRALVEDITDRSPDTLVVVASIIPITNSGTNQRVITYNAGVEAVVSELATSGDHVIFVDNYAAIETSPNWQGQLMADYLHPNDAGYAILGQSFYDAISGFLH